MKWIVTAALVSTALTCCCVLADFSDDFDTKPNIRINYLSLNSDQIETFLGNQTHRDHFKLLRSDGVSLLIGARNVVYNLSLADLSENSDQRITWPSNQSDQEMCEIKGKTKDECQNYIRVLAQTDTKHLLVCGTNSYKPKCRTYTTLKPKTATKVNPGSKVAKVPASLGPVEEEELPYFQMKHEYSGLGICPHDPRHNSTAIYADGELYSGTTADFSGSDALIYRTDVRTEQNDLRHLNAPDFVSSMEDADHVYFFFRETAVEYINCGKTVYSRVARVCKNDAGGPQRYKDRWTTFIKSRLNCSISGEFPFYFDEIQGTADAGDLSGDRMIYGVFTTPQNSISGSAVCAFKLSDILKSFEGNFKGQSTTVSNWLPIRNERGAGQCSSDSKKLDESTLNFMKGHSLKDEAVNNIYAAPLFVKTAVNERLTKIAVDPRVRTPADDNTYDVMYVGTTRGKVLKVISIEDKERFDLRSGQTSARKPVVIEEMQVFPYHVPVANVQVVTVKESGKKKLIVLSDHEVKAMPLHRCNAGGVQSCRACVSLQDPHCAWNVQTRRCVDSSQFSKADASSLLQDVFYGKHEGCEASEGLSLKVAPPAIIDKDTDVATNEIDDTAENLEELQDEIDIVIDFEPEENEAPYFEGRALNPNEVIYSETALTTATTVSALIALVIGLVTGALLQRKFSKDGYRNCGHHYLEQQAHINKQNETSALHHTESGYTTSPCNNISSSASVSGGSSSSGGSTAASTLPDSSSAMSGSHITHKNSNLLVNLTTKSEPEKNNVIGSSSSTAVAPSTCDTSIIYNGTIPRNGTLCKKVYL